MAFDALEQTADGDASPVPRSEASALLMYGRRTAELT